MIPSGVLSYTTTVASARTEVGQSSYPSSLGSLSVYSNKRHPKTGLKIEGWHWDEKVWPDNSIENIAMSIPSNWDPTISGITKTSFQSGIGSNNDLMLEGVEEIPSSGLNETGVFNVWAPKVNHGYYYDFDAPGYLFSDDSEIKYATYSGVADNGYLAASGFNQINLMSDLKVAIPIKVQQSTWNNEAGKYEISLDLRKRIHFSGTRDSDGARLTTFSEQSQSILWDNIDQTVDEFIVVASGEFPSVILNRQYVEKVGTGVVPSGLEFVGYAKGLPGQQFHLSFSPIDESLPIGVYSQISTSGVVTQWEAVPLDIIPSGNQVRVDYDLGILEFGDLNLPDQNIPQAGASIFASYYKTLAVEFEPDKTKDAITATESNINPIYRKSSYGFVHLSTRSSDPASIKLTASLPQIQENVYGPMSIGNIFAPLTGTVKDSKGQLLENQTVRFSVLGTSLIGGFGSSSSVISTTDELGESQAFYSPPRDISEIGEEVLASGWSQTLNPTDPLYSGLAQITTLHTESVSIEGDLIDTFLYEVHVDDPIQGLLDVTLSQNNADVQISGYYTGYFNEQNIQGGTRNIEWEDIHRTTWNLAKPVLYSQNAGLGRKKLVSKVDSTAINPHTFEPGAVVPMQPINVQATGGGEYDITFDTSSYSIPQPTGSKFPNPSGTLYSYFIVAPTTVRLQASVYNERLDQTILSNEISIKLSIPPYLSGLWIMDAINQNHINEISSTLASGITASGQKVPLGFRLRSSQVTLAAALNGVTFLDINRQWNSDPYNPDTVSGVRIGHKFSIT